MFKIAHGNWRHYRQTKGNSTQMDLQSQARDAKRNFEKYKARIVVKGFS
jgi:hypothetical protein